MKSLLVLASFALVSVAVPRLADAGCPQVDGCNAVAKITASLQNAPACFRVDGTEPDNHCVCYGSVRLVNDCAYEVVLPDDSMTIGASQLATLAVGGSDETADSYHEEHKLVGDGQTFTLVIDYTAEYRELETGCSMSPRTGTGFTGLGLGLGLAALAVARRRKPSALT